MIYSTVLLEVPSRRKIASTAYWPISPPSSVLKKYLDFRLKSANLSGRAKYRPMIIDDYMFLSRECGEEALLVFISCSLANPSTVMKMINRSARVIRFALKNGTLTGLKVNYQSMIDPIVSDRFAVALVGMRGVGKTSLLHLIMGRQQEGDESINPTIGLSTTTIEGLRFGNYKMVVIDYAGGEGISRIGELGRTDLVLLLTDSTLGDVIAFKRILDNMHSAYPDLPILLIANKQDLPNALDPSAIGQVIGAPVYAMVAIDLAHRQELLLLLLKHICTKFDIPVPDGPIEEVLSVA